MRGRKEDGKRRTVRGTAVSESVNRNFWRADRHVSHRILFLQFYDRHLRMLPENTLFLAPNPLRYCDSQHDVPDWLACSPCMSNVAVVAISGSTVEGYFC